MLGSKPTQCAHARSLLFPPTPTPAPRSRCPRAQDSGGPTVVGIQDSKGLQGEYTSMYTEATPLAQTRTCFRCIKKVF